MSVRRNSTALMMAVVAVLAAVAGGCALPAATSPTTSTSVPCLSGGPVGPGCAATPPVPGTVAIGLCGDLSGSMPPGVLMGVVDAIADAVADWPGIPPADPQVGAEGRLALDVTARRITAGSFASAGLVLRIHVPPVPAIFPRPPVTDASFVEGSRRWRGERDAAAAALTTAQSAAQEAAASLRASSFESDGSRVTGCIAALAETLPPAFRRAVVVTSDLIETGAEQIAGDLLGAPVTVVQPCDDPTDCQERATHFKQVLAAMGAGSVTFIRPEALPDHLPGIFGDPLAH